MIHHYEGRRELAGHGDPLPLAPVAVLGESDNSPLQIRIAGNEQQPLRFMEGYAVVTRGSMGFFDMGLNDNDDFKNFAIERKGLADWISSMVMQDNFNHELINMVEASWEQVMDYDYSVFCNRDVTSQFLYRQWAVMEYDHNVQVIFANNRYEAAFRVSLIFKRRRDHLDGVARRIAVIGRQIERGIEKGKESVAP
jgi:hypothetical protein